MLELRRGDARDLFIADLTDGFGNPAVFQAGDVLTWTAKTRVDRPTVENLIVKVSTDGGVEVGTGTDQAIVHLVASDWVHLPTLAADLPFVWDLELLVGGDPEKVVTLAEEVDAVIHPDVHGNVGPPLAESASDTGPCTRWTTLDDVLAEPTARDAEGHPLDRRILQEMIDVAGSILYRLSGRQFAGVCTETARPTRRWYRAAYASPWYWIYDRAGSGAYTTNPPHRDAGNVPSREITLGAYPLRRIISVYEDGVLVDPADYRINDRRWLQKISADGLPWKVAPDLDADAGAPGTFIVNFEYGQAPPRAGVRACKTLAIELTKHASGSPCNLPERVQSLVMQNASYTLLDPMSFLDKGKTGMYIVDLFLATFNPRGLKRRSSVLSPDLPRPVRRVGTVPGS